ncbi:hypothetical protein FisN_16Lh075 [Fistulifera solaris]|uniref:Pentacotripeptide-repeat region of PRORP domain-containing protein n=1 Tax=Fistulifera solaris TaxID=1519565 RepID=A0A1Z5KJ58_FISSO|nr:hypothetical protein FisN_16Lh075 [Fistulifera solaris]|eukprot:GAX26247.1 hypothetical protein FisN_16Lh075 [Fistulifera solaris]
MRRLGRPISRLQHWLVTSPHMLFARTVTTTFPTTRTTESLSVKVQTLLSQKQPMTLSQWQLGDKTLQLLSQQSDQGELAEALLERMVSEASPEKQPVTVWYRWVMRAWALTTTTTTTTTTTRDDSTKENQLPYSVLRAHQLLERMQQRHLLFPQHPAPDIAVYDAFLYVCASTRPYSAAVATLAQSLVQHMEHTGNPYPSTLSYNNVLSILLQSPQYGAASQAEDWLLRLSERSAAGEGSAQPNTQSFNRVLHAWTNGLAPDRAYAILQFMMQHNSSSIAPDVVSFATVIHAYRDNPETAEHIFYEALEYFVGTTIDLTQCLDAVLIAWAYSCRPDAVEKVQALLRNAYDVPQLEPTAATHRICLQAFLQHGKVDAATQYLYEMIAVCRSVDKTTLPKNTPSIVTTGAFHVVLQGWLDSGRPEAPEESQKLLQLMMELSHELPCAPEANTFTRCLQIVWNHKGSPQSALQILEQAEQRQMVNFYVYKWVLQILERSPSYAFVAYDVLQRALMNVPVESTALHRLTMDTLLKHRSLSAMQLALQLLLHEFPDHSVQAMELSYVSVLQAFARTGRAGTVAEEVYQHILRNKPNIRHNAVIGNAILQTMVQT